MADAYLEKLAKLVRLIYWQTESGKIDWEDYDLSGTAFQTEIAGKKVVISEIDYVVDGEPTQDIEISIYNNVDAKIESIRDTKLVNINVGILGFSGWYALMRYILESARRRVNGSESAINELIDALDEIPF